MTSTILNCEAPPFLILHGEQDTAVPVDQAQALYQKLLDADVDVKLMIVENAENFLISWAISLTVC
ncbi:MAG TPA: prolyl oligopeptidase family serine peptidase [Anaerolineales bacterium]|nr:prolyl oligopeptidase family serine peptidase [Anaerolineales bacterium]